MNKEALLLYLYCVDFVTLQQTAGLWGLTTPTPEEIGAGRRLTVLRSLWLICCAPFKKRGQMRACQSASKTWQPNALLSPLVFSLRLPEIQFSLLSSCLNSFLRYTGTTSRWAEVWSVCIFIFSEQWDVICMHLNMHISVFFRESFVFIFVVFNDNVIYIFFISPFSL